MKNGKRKVIAKIAGPGLVLAALLALTLSNPGVGRAQASATPAVAPTQTTAAAPASPAHKPAAKGQNEGIHVHGHWTIEVRNPDGKLVSHTEFENALVQPMGAGFLTQVLNGELITGGYVVNLSDGAPAVVGPCPMINSSVTACILVGSLISPEPAGFGDYSSRCGGTGFTNQISAAGPCFPLSISLASGSTGLAFSGTAVASTAGTITDVFLDPIVCFTPNTPNSTNDLVMTSPSACAQGAGVGVTTSSATDALTHATLPAPVTIASAGQLISVNVQLSFQ